MAVIAALFDFEEGHFLTSFKLAKQLRDRGHDVYYLGPAGVAAVVREQGFPFVPVFEKLLTGISRSAQAQELVSVSAGFRHLLSGEALDEVMSRIKPDLMLTLSLYYLDALAVHVLYHVPVVLWTTFCPSSSKSRAELVQSWISDRLMDLKSSDVEATLRAVRAAGYQFSSFVELADLVLAMPELVTLPRAIELPQVGVEPNVHYVGTGIDVARHEEPFAWSEIAGGRYLVYCSLGSQAELEPAIARRFFQAVLDVGSARPEWQLILATGKGFDPAELTPAPANVHVSRWVPQLDVLRRADLMVTHGGPGSVKESILLGVPMVALPLMRDQFEMTRRIVHHQLGVEGSLSEITAEALAALISNAANDTSLKDRVAAMRRLFEESDRSSIGVDLIEATLAQRR